MKTATAVKEAAGGAKAGDWWRDHRGGVMIKVEGDSLLLKCPRCKLNIKIDKEKIASILTR